MIPLILALLSPASAEEMQSGAMEYVLDGQVQTLPMVRTEVDADIHGDLATVRMVQTAPDSLPPGSDVCNLALMGYNAEDNYTGRAAIEAL